MGILKKAFKAIKKVVKKISKVTGVDKLIRTIGGAVKGAVNSFGKFMGKIGILGQIAMMFILPGIGGMLMQGAAGLAGWGGGMIAAGQAAGGVMGALQAGVGHMASFVGTAVTTTGNVFANVTKGVTDTLGNFADTLGAKMGFKTGGATNFFGSGGADSAWSRSFGQSSRFSNLTMDYKAAGKLANAAGEVAKQASKTGVVITEEAINQEAVLKVAQEGLADDFAASLAADKAAEAAATGGLGEIAAESSITTNLPDAPSLLDKGVTPKEGLGMDEIVFDPIEIEMPQIQKPSLMDKVKNLPAEMMEEIKKLPDKAIDYAKESPERLMKQALETPERAAKQYVSTRVQEEALKGAHGEGFRQAPATEVTYNTMSIPAIEAAMSPMQMQSADVADYRYFMSDISSSPTPYGNTAYQYGQGYQQYMRSLT